VDFSLAPGQSCGICGRTGAGKSSLLGCLLRLTDVESGPEALVALGARDGEFGRGLQATSREPADFGSKSTVLLNNHWPGWRAAAPHHSSGMVATQPVPTGGAARGGRPRLD